MPNKVDNEILVDCSKHLLRIIEGSGGESFSYPGAPDLGNRPYQLNKVEADFYNTQMFLSARRRFLGSFIGAATPLMLFAYDQRIRAQMPGVQRWFPSNRPPFFGGLACILLGSWLGGVYARLASLKAGIMLQDSPLATEVRYYIRQQKPNHYFLKGTPVDVLQDSNWSVFGVGDSADTSSQDRHEQSGSASERAVDYIKFLTTGSLGGSSRGFDPSPTAVEGRSLKSSRHTDNDESRFDMSSYFD